jgi:hypothetical protein
MYSLSSAEQANFLSTDFMHVSTESTDYSTVGGALENVKVTAGGASGTNGSYTSVVIRGDGTGGRCTVVVGANAVSSVTITTAGTGYTFASVLASDIGSVVGADIDFIISPPGGHATDVVAELGGFYVMTNTILIRNPIDSDSAATATESTLDCTKSIVFSGSPGTFVADEKITQSSSGAVGYVIDYTSGTKTLRYIQPQFANQGIDSNGTLTAFTGTDTVTGATSSATGTPSTHDTTPELQHDSGDILYIENRKPVTRASDQTENVKLIVEF